MADTKVQIKPTGLSQHHLVDLLYMIVKSIYTICAKLDADGGVPATDYLANVYTAIFNGEIIDSRGNQLINRVSTRMTFYSVTPTGVTPAAVLELLYQIFDMMETLTEQLDGDSLTGTDFEALCYTALYLWKVTNQENNTLGNGVVYWFNPGGELNQRELVDCLAAIVNSIDVLTQKLDADGTVTDTNYEALCDTAIILMQVRNSQESTYGNAVTTYE
jgi:hypothetical protein